MSKPIKADYRSGGDLSPGARSMIGRSINKLVFPFKEKPVEDSVIEIADGALWARIPLPWSLDHINVYLFDEGDGWSVVDTGAQGQRGKTAWEQLLSGPMQGKPVKKVISTHMHPDHVGLAGWLVRRFGADFYMTSLEYSMSKILWMSASEEIPDFELDFLFRSGVSRDIEPMVRSVGYGTYKKGVCALPEVLNRLEDGNVITLGGKPYLVVIGRGHSPEHACLYGIENELFIAGDQVLPGITSNVSVFAREPNANPLAHWITALDRLKTIPGEPLVLPSHGRIYKGFHIRLDDLIAGHVEKLGQLAGWCAESRSAVECFPALYQRKITGFDFFMALGEAIAHLRLLEALGVIERDRSGDIDRYKTIAEFNGADIVAECAAMPGVALRDLSPLLDLARSG